MKYAFVVVLLFFSITGAYADDGSIVHFGPILKEFIKWTAAAFGTALAATATAVLYRVFSYFGVQTTESQRNQLQGIIVNGLNDAATKAEAAIVANPKLDVDVKQKIIADAIDYAQRHGADTIKALGLDPNSGEAVAVIKARIATAVADPNTPTPAALDKQPLAPK